MVTSGFLARVLLAAGLACIPLAIGGLPGFVAAALSGAIFLVVGLAIGMVPREVRDAFAWR